MDGGQLFHARQLDQTLSPRLWNDIKYDSVHSHLHALMTVVSPLWALRAFRQSFFKRLGVCWLHVFLQGIFKVMLSAVTAGFTCHDLQRAFFYYLALLY